MLQKNLEFILSKVNFVSFCLVQERNLLLCTNIAVTQSYEFTKWNINFDYDHITNNPVSNSLPPPLSPPFSFLGNSGQSDLQRRTLAINISSSFMKNKLERFWPRLIFGVEVNSSTLKCSCFCHKRKTRLTGEKHSSLLCQSVRETFIDIPQQ